MGMKKAAAEREMGFTPIHARPAARAKVSLVNFNCEYPIRPVFCGRSCETLEDVRSLAGQRRI